MTRGTELAFVSSSMESYIKENGAMIAPKDKEFSSVHLMRLWKPALMAGNFRTVM